MAISSRSIAVQSSKINARLAAAKRQGSQEAFRLQLASLGEALAANASPEVALEYMKEAQNNRLPKVEPETIICAITTTAVYTQLNKARVRR